MKRDVKARGKPRRAVPAYGSARFRRGVLTVAVVAGTLSGYAAVEAIGTPSAGAATLTHVTWTKLAPATSPTKRDLAAMAYDTATGNVVLFGGLQSATTFGDTWTWNGTTWTKLTPATSPPARRRASMAYDPATGNMVLFGGKGTSGTLNDTWTWNGSTWAKHTPATSPTARLAAAMAYDPATGTMLLFGGTGPSGSLNDTWSWNGTNWTKLTPATSPTARYGSSMAYDPTTGNMVLFGGADPPTTGPSPTTPTTVPATDPSFNDTWTWNGTTWTKLTPATSPTVRYGAPMVYVPATGELVLFGGHDGGYYADTWTWNGTTWTKLTPATSPTARYGASMSYDPATSATVLFGGQAASAAFLGDTWTLTTVPGKPPRPAATPGDSEATVTWTAPTTGGTPITGYTVTSSPGSRTCTTTGAARTCIITGLTNGTSYTFTVRAKNANGTGETSTPSTPVIPELPIPLLQPFRLTVTPGTVTMTCTSTVAYTAKPKVTQDVTVNPGATCALVHLGKFQLNGQRHVVGGWGHSLIISTARGTPTDDWSLSGIMVPTPNTLTGNANCDIVPGFCNKTTTTTHNNKPTLPHYRNTSITPNYLYLTESHCRPNNTAPATPYFNTNTPPTNRAPQNPATLTTQGLSVSHEICTAAAGSSGGQFFVTTLNYTLIAPADIYAGVYYGTVQYTLTPSGIKPVGTVTPLTNFVPLAPIP